MKIVEIIGVVSASEAFIAEALESGFDVERVTVRVRPTDGPRTDVVVTNQGNVTVQPQQPQRDPGRRT